MNAFLNLAMQIGARLLSAGLSAEPIIAKLEAMWAGQAQPTDADFAELHSIEAAQTAVIQAPIPGDPV